MRQNAKELCGENRQNTKELCGENRQNTKEAGCGQALQTAAYELEQFLRREVEECGAKISLPALRGGEDVESRDNGRGNNSEGGGTRGADAPRVEPLDHITKSKWNP